ncbi:helix-turn-helix transcriptional regulator [Shigella sonnei]|nr:helix-turn-helix transcriptional regulator [Shigella sonnei]
MEKNGKEQTSLERTIEENSIVRFKDRLKEAMGSISNHAFARKCGLSEASIRKYIRGESYPTIDNAAKLAAACDVSLGWLLTGGDEEFSHHNQTERAPEPKTFPPECRVEKYAEHQSNAALQAMMQCVSPQDAKSLYQVLCNIGIKGVLQQLQHPSEQPESAEEAIRALNIRESLKDAICMALPGNEYTDREILRGIESRARERSPDGSQPLTTPDDDSVKKTA